MIVKLLREDGKLVVIINGKSIVVNGFKPVDLLLAGLAYGLGIRFMDKTGINEYSMECEFNGDGVVCRGPCSGHEEHCLVFRIVTKGLLKFNCLSNDDGAQGSC